METVINKLAEIEAGAAKILEDANNKKVALAKELEDKSRIFSEETDAATTKKLDAIKTDYQEQMKKDLAELQAHTQRVLSGMEEHFQKEHEARTDEIIKQILK